MVKYDYKNHIIITIIIIRIKIYLPQYYMYEKLLNKKVNYMSMDRCNHKYLNEVRKKDKVKI